MEGVIFDLDGTLLDTEGATCEWIAKILGQHGLSWTLDLHKQVAGTMHFFPGKCLDLLGVGAERREQLLKLLPPRLTSPEYNSFMIERAQIKDGAQALIRHLQSRRLPLGLCTSRQGEGVLAIEAGRPDVAALLAPLTARILGSVDPRSGVKLPSKPEPHVYTACAELLGVCPAKCVVFEDAPSGIKAAKAAGTFTVAVPESWMLDNFPGEEVFDMADMRLKTLSDFNPDGLFGKALPLLVACGNPTVDITCEVSNEELQKLQLTPGSEAAGFDDAAKARIVDFATGKHDTELTAGGSALNTVRAAAVSSGLSLRTAFIGATGQDANAEILRTSMKRAGVLPLLQVEPLLATGMCASLVEPGSRDRALAAVRGAAGALKPEWLAQNDVAAILNEAALVYVESFLLTTQPRISFVERACSHCHKQGIPFAINLSSAGILPKVKQPLLQILCKCRFVFGNTGELRVLASMQGWQCETAFDKEAAAQHLASLLDTNGIAVVTAGAESTTIAHQGGSVKSCDVEHVPACEVVDTNGAGDAFVGGFLAKFLTRDASMEECAASGHRVAAAVLRRRGCDLGDIMPSCS